MADTMADVTVIQVSQVMKTQCRNGLKGQRANSPGHRPGYRDVGKLALKGQKPTCRIVSFALTGRWLRITSTQGDAQGWDLSGLSVRLSRNLRKLNNLIFLSI